jgi:HSP20 family protein
VALQSQIFFKLLVIYLLSVKIVAGKKQEKTKKASAKKDVVPVKPRKRPSPMLEPYKPSDFWMEFDKAFDRFRRDFEDLLWPSEREFAPMSELATRLPSVDLEDKTDKFVLTAEVPGFKKDEIEITVGEDSVEISGCSETKQDEKAKGYLRKERSSQSFYRRMILPEEVNVDESQANLQDGILELVLPKKVPKKKKKVAIK